MIYSTMMRVFLLLPILTISVCPFHSQGTPPSQRAPIPYTNDYNAALKELDIGAVLNDIEELLTDSQQCWPADTFNGESSYGPLFVRLAWHCSGTYRYTDGLGGCSGGRQRFDPEASWEDNTNLDKARALLAPIKNKYGIGLSWGDLMIFAGNAAIINMDGPVNEICAGRVDDSDGTKSKPLNIPCSVQGDCPEPYGADTVGLIYVNPEGFMGLPDPRQSAQQIRKIFKGRMNYNDRETVALIGGGHAFGKSHGAKSDDVKLDDATSDGSSIYTSGIEGQWTTNPLKWDNEFFQQLISDNYVLIKGPGDHYQWKNERNGYMMMTTDIALVNDYNYRQIVQEFAEDLDALDTVFATAWKKLTESGGTWATNKHCIDVHW